MRIASLVVAAAAIVALGVFVLLVGNHDLREADMYNEMTDDARHLAELDERLGRTVLATQNGLVPSYDALTITLREMRGLQDDLARALDSLDDATLLDRGERTDKLLRDDQALIEAFESNNSVLRNTMVYLPVALENVAQGKHFTPSPSAQREATGLLAAVFRCRTACDAATQSDVARSIDAIRVIRDGATGQEREALDVILKHGAVFARYAPIVDRCVRDLLATDQNPYDELYVALRARHDHVAAQTNVHRACLALLSLALLVSLGVTIRRLRRNASALERALVGLAVEKGVVDEKQRELAYLNQSLESRVEIRTHEVATSREQYRSLLETTQAIPWEMDPETLRFSYVGPQAHKTLGYPVHAWTGDGFLWSRLVPEDRVEAIRRLKSDDRSANGGEAEGAAGEVEFRMLAADGRPVWLRGLVSDAADSSARKVRRGIFLDVTARRTLETELRAAQKLESIGRLASGIAHEINTPVQFVSDSVTFVSTAFEAFTRQIGRYRDATAAGLAPDRAASLAEAARAGAEESDLDYLMENVPPALQSSLDGLERIATIVASMKEFSHPDRKQKSATDLNANILSTLTIARNEYKNIAEVHTDLAKLPLVICHAGEINQVILNLIVNAAHAIDEATRTARTRAGLGSIAISTRLVNRDVVVAVTDTGTGIPEEARDKLFDPFFTTKEVGRGTGQGLSIARNIVVEKHGGQIWFTTEIGRGTSFFVRIPIGAAHVASDAAA